MKKCFPLALCLILVAGMVLAGCGPQEAGEGRGAIYRGVLPRNETMFFDGLTWSVPTRWNPYGIGGSSHNLWGHTFQAVFETLFVFDLLDESINPHIGESYTWDGYNLRVIIRRDVRFNNGAALRIDDVVHSFVIHRDYNTPFSGIWAGDFILDVVPIDEASFEIRGNPQRFQPTKMLEILCSFYITSKVQWDEILRERDPDRGGPRSNRMAVAQEPKLEPISTASYRPLFWDETRIVLERDDNWWGTAKDGKLPVPRYLVFNVGIPGRRSQPQQAILTGSP